MAPDEKPKSSGGTTPATSDAADRRGSSTSKAPNSRNGHATKAPSSPTPSSTYTTSPSPEPPPPPITTTTTTTATTAPQKTPVLAKFNGSVTEDLKHLQQQEDLKQQQMHQQQKQQEDMNHHQHQHQHQQEDLKQQQQNQLEEQRRDSVDSDASLESFEDYIPSPPDGGYGWVIVLASLFCNMIVDGLGYSFGVFLLEFADYFKESKSKVSLVGSLLCGVYLFAGPVVSAMTNKFGCRPVAVVGSVIASVAFALSVLAPSVDVLIITYGVMGGFGLGMIYLPAIVSVGYYFEKKRALATGIAVCGSGIGTFIFAPLSEFLLQEMDWKNALLIISGITLNGAVMAMLMRPLEPGKPQRRPRAKNLLDRIKEQAKGTRDRTFSENSTNTQYHREANAVLQGVMEAKLLRERRLQEDESELGSLPSIFLVRQQSHRDSSRVHKLSISDRGDALSCVDSPMGSMARMPWSAQAPSSLSIQVEAKPAKAKPQPAVVVDSPSAEEGERSSPGTGKEQSKPPSSPRQDTKEEEARSKDGSKTSASSGNDAEKKGETGEGSTKAKQATSSPSRTDEESSFCGTFVDAESETVGDGTKSERSEYLTPPTSPRTSCSPPLYDMLEEGDCRTARPVLDSPKNELVARLLARSGKDLKNGSVPTNIHHHVHEVVPLLQVPDRKTTMVNLGSEKNMWRLKNLQAPVQMCGQSLLSLSVSKKDLARPLYRKDIFYSGSIQHLPLFRSQPDMKSYITSITAIPGEPMLLAGGEAKVWRCLGCCPQSFKDTLQEMLDMSLLRDWGFMLVCLGNVFAFLGFYVPFVYCVDFAVNMGIDKNKAAFLISIIGITNTVGRVVTGWLADLRRINSLVITYVSIFVCGLSTALFPFCNSYGLLCAVASLFGLSVASFISLSSILICDLLGLEKLTNGFGLMSLFRGMAAMAGPPLAGFIYEQTLSYDTSFYVGGALLVAGSACHLALNLPCVKDRQQPQFYVETVEEITAPVGSGVTPELITLEEVMNHV